LYTEKYENIKAFFKGNKDIFLIIVFSIDILLALTPKEIISFELQKNYVFTQFS